ncbi:hypothetical protein GGR56DRAFT_445400 [Xylariaceae sp. FL0804]|nr:hypothetical protein GGR56DRAFT_445400 [Xylariaceae sp. FL0804]
MCRLGKLAGSQAILRACVIALALSNCKAAARPYRAILKLLLGNPPIPNDGFNQPHLRASSPLKENSLHLLSSSLLLLLIVVLFDTNHTLSSLVHPSSRVCRRLGPIRPSSWCLPVRPSWRPSSCIWQTSETRISPRRSEI